MLDFKLVTSKHGRRRGQKKLPGNTGFKSRRRAIASFEGQRLGMRRSLIYSSHDIYLGKYAGVDYDHLPALMAASIGHHYDEVFSKFVKRYKKKKRSPREIFDDFLGQGYYSYIRRTGPDPSQNIGWAGYYVAEDGTIQENRSAVYYKLSRFRPRRVPKKYVEYNKANRNLQGNHVNGLVKAGSLYVIRMDTNKIVPNPVPVWIVPGQRFDLMCPETRMKDRLYLKGYTRVCVPGFPMEIEKERPKSWNPFDVKFGRVFYYITRTNEIH